METLSAHRLAVGDGTCEPGEICVVRSALDRQASSQPDKAFAVFTDGSAWTYRLFREIVIRTAAGLQRQGVRQGDRVLCWLPNGAAMLRAIFALNYIGAICIPINIGYRGTLLEHVIGNASARLMIAHADLVPRLAEIHRGELERVIAFGAHPVPLPGIEIVPWEVLNDADNILQPLEQPIRPWDTQSIIYTSGTTGPSKGVLSSYMHAYSSVGPGTWTCVTAEDRFLINLPMFHIGGIFISHAMLCAGGSIAVVERFSTDAFWDEVRKTQATVAFLLGSMATFLLKRRPTPEDRQHPLRKVFLVPLLKGVVGFGERFGVDTYTLYNMTEISTPTFSDLNPTKAASCGKPRDGVEVRLVDEHDCEVPRGQVGEMIVRTRQPWTMNHGYHNAAEATTKAWRNGWFHTGDAFYIDDDGDYIFVDRLKDTIRRRGENISSAEVEAEILSFPAVREAAAIPVPSEFGEDEVLAAIALQPGQDQLDLPGFIAYLASRLPHFMVPRYVRILPELPKTPTAKVMKAVLRQSGVTPDTWDRNAAGIRLRSERLG